MGINITIENENGNIPEWDFIRHEGDKHVPKILYDAEVENHPDNDRKLDFYRPVDVDYFERRLLEQIDVNKARWEQMARLLRNPDNWLYFSY